MLRERPGIGQAYLFPAPGDVTKPVSRYLSAKWLQEAEELAGLEKLDGSLWHAYRRKWATERKHLPDADVAAAGGWANPNTLRLVYQQADADTMLRVVLELGGAQRGRSRTMACKRLEHAHEHAHSKTASLAPPRKAA